MTTQEKKLIKKTYKNSNFDIREQNRLGIVHLLNDIDVNLSFSIEFREDENSSWLQAEVYSPKTGYSTIIDYDVPNQYNSIDCLIRELERLEDIAKSII